MLNGKGVLLRITGQNKVILCGVVLVSLFSLMYLESFGLPSSNHPKKVVQKLTRNPGGDTMQIQFERTGGFAGMRLAAMINAESLSQEEARRLRELVDAAGFFELPTELTGLPRGTDRFLYTLTVEVEGQRHTVHTSEAAAPAALRSLINWLTNVARRQQRSTSNP